MFHESRLANSTIILRISECFYGFSSTVLIHQATLPGLILALKPAGSRDTPTPTEYHAGQPSLLQFFSRNYLCDTRFRYTSCSNNMKDHKLLRKMYFPFLTHARWNKVGIFCSDGKLLAGPNHAFMTTNGLTYIVATNNSYFHQKRREFAPVSVSILFIY